MKFSIYVSDQLWEKARRARPDAQSASQLVQDALQRMTVEQQSQGRVPADMAPEFDAIRARLVKEAAIDFDKGYRAALAASAELDWSDVEVLADHFKFDVRQWAEAWKDHAERSDLARDGLAVLYPGEGKAEAKKVNALMKVLGSWAAPHDFEEWIPGQTYVKGFAHAMRSLWATVGRDVGNNTAPDQEAVTAVEGVSPESESES